MSQHCDNCSPEFTECWNDGSKCRKKPMDQAKKPDVIRLYGLADQENLDSSIDEVVENVFEDACHAAGEPFDVIARRIQWPIRVHVFKRKDTSVSAGRLASNALNDALESLDEEYGSSEGVPTEATRTMKLAADAFAQAVIKEYVPWACEKTGEVIDVTIEMARGMME